MTLPAKSQEPATEEVLVSVRRIIADDDGSKTPQRAAAPPKLEVQSAAPSRKIEAYSDVSLDEAKQKPVMQKSMEGSALFARGDGEHGLLSSATSSAVDSAFNMLAQTLLVQDARTLEDLVRETLRPTLKSWLDDNLPRIVERSVRVEIERAARRH